MCISQFCIIYVCVCVSLLLQSTSTNNKRILRDNGVRRSAVRAASVPEAGRSVGGSLEKREPRKSNNFEKN